MPAKKKQKNEKELPDSTVQIKLKPADAAANIGEVPVASSSIPIADEIKVNSASNSSATNSTVMDIQAIHSIIYRYMNSSSVNKVNKILDVMTTAVNKLRNKVSCIEIQDELISLLKSRDYYDGVDDDEEEITEEEERELLNLFGKSICIKSQQRKADYHIFSETVWKLCALEGDDFVICRLHYRGDGESGDGDTSWKLSDRSGKEFDCSNYRRSGVHTPFQELLQILKLQHQNNATRVLQLMKRTTEVTAGMDDDDDESDDDVEGI